MHNHLLFVDTETSGIPQSLNAPVTDLDNWPFVLQIAWLVYDVEGNLLKEANHFIYEEDIYIQESSIKIHGITQDELKAKGEDRKYVLKKFASDLRKYKPLVIGHFVEFDSKMLQVALFRAGQKNILKDYRHFCTMRSTTDYAVFPNNEYPKLEELHIRLFNERMERSHDAAIDVAATAKCFFELYRRGELNDEILNNQPLFIKIGNKIGNKTGCGLPVLLFITIGLALLLL
ncbi:MAG: 3'-5' exonuclease [Marinoscillum sp.]